MSNILLSFILFTLSYYINIGLISKLIGKILPFIIGEFFYKIFFLPPKEKVKSDQWIKKRYLNLSHIKE